jgi:hypothetical protein
VAIDVVKGTIALAVQAPLKPLSRARRPPALRRREARDVLTAHAIDALFRAAEVLAEGELDDRGARRAWYGTVLITFDLASLAAECRELHGEDALDRVAATVEGSVRVRLLAHRLARSQVTQRYPGREVGTLAVQSRFRRQGAALFLDIDLEAPLGVPSRERSAR